MKYVLTYELAENAFNRALELDPDLVEARMLMVFIYLSRGEKQKARAEVSRVPLTAASGSFRHPLFLACPHRRLPASLHRCQTPSAGAGFGSWCVGLLVSFSGYGAYC